MKKITFFFAVLALASCGSSKKSCSKGDEAKATTTKVVEKTTTSNQPPTPVTPPMPAKRQRIQQLKIDESFKFDAKKNSNFTINSIVIKGSILHVDIQYSGGCKPHQFDLITNMMMTKSMPPQLSLYIDHNANGESCREVMKEGVNELM